MRILFVSATNNPFEQNKNGSIQRSHLLLEACASVADVDVAILRDGYNAIPDIKNCRIVLATNIWRMNDETRIDKLKKILLSNKIHRFYPIDKRIVNLLSPILQAGNYDFIVVRYLPPAIRCGLLKYYDRLIIDVDDSPIDVEKMMIHKVKSIRSKIYHLIVSKLMRKTIEDTLNLIKHSFFSNSSQVHLIKSSYLPNIPFYNCFKHPTTEKLSHRIIFVGDLRYEPNRLGIEHFIKYIFPSISTAVLNVEFVIIGKYLNEDWKKMIESNSPNIHVCGFVEDIATEYCKCGVCVIPIYMGAGTNIKVIEALQMQCACVVTKQATRGYPELVDNENIMIACSDDEFVSKTIYLLQNSCENNRISHNGKYVAEQNYSKNTFFCIVKKVLTC